MSQCYLLWNTRHVSNLSRQDSQLTYYVVCNPKGLNDTFYLYFPILFSFLVWGAIAYDSILYTLKLHLVCFSSFIKKLHVVWLGGCFKLLLQYGQKYTIEFMLLA